MPIVKCPHLGCGQVFKPVYEYEEDKWRMWYLCPYCGGIVHVRIRNGSSKIKKIIAHKKIPPLAKIVVGGRLEEEVF